jgi:hypothetical protein
VADSVDLASLVVSVDASSAVEAAPALDNLTAAATRTEAATRKLDEAARREYQSMMAFAGMHSTASERIDSSTKASDKFEMALQRQAETLGMTRSQLAAYNAAHIEGVDMQFAQKYIDQMKAAESETGGIVDRMQGRFQTMALRSGLHFVVITVAIMGVVSAFKDMLTYSDRVIAFNDKLVEFDAKAAIGAAKVAQEIEKENQAIKDGYKTHEESVNAHSRVLALRDELLAQGPEYRKALANENMSWQDILTTLKAINAEKLKSVNDQIATMEKNHTEQVTPGFFTKAGDLIKANIAGAGRLGGASQRYDEEIDLKTKENEMKYQTELNKLYKDKADLEKDYHEKDPPAKKAHNDALKEEITYERELATLQKDGLALMDKKTIAQKEIEELAALDLKYRDQAQRYDNEVKQGSLTKAQGDSLKIDSIEQYQARAQQVREKYAQEQVTLQEKVNHDVGALEELSYAQKREKMVQAFEKDKKEVADENASIAKLKAQGKDTGLTAMQAPDQGAFDAYLSAFDARERESAADRMITGLKTIEKEKGVALDFTEQIASLDAVAKKLGIDVPGAADLAKQKLEDLQARQADGWAGAAAALKDFSIKSQDQFDKLKGYSSSWIKTFEDDIVQLCMTGKTNWKGLVDAMIADMIRFNLEKNVIGPASNWLSGVVSAAGSYFAGGASGGSSGADAGYSSLGSGNYSDYSGLAGGASKVPQSRGGSSGAQNISISVNVDASGQQQSQATGGAGGSSTGPDSKDAAAKIGKMIADGAYAVIVREMRVNGVLNRGIKG